MCNQQPGPLISNKSSEPNLRLFVPDKGWVVFSDPPEKDDNDQGKQEQGSREQIESAFNNALNASNLVLLTGAGSSLYINADRQPTVAPTMSDLWKGVKAAVGDDVFQSILTKIPKAPTDKKPDIERLLSLAKIYTELHDDKDVLAFIQKAEQDILTKVGFVKSDTNLSAHETLISKIGRRGHRMPRAKVFTTNYDLCFEEAAKRRRFTMIDGFSRTLEQVYDRSYYEIDMVRRDGSQEGPDYIPNVFHLYKLHGSCDWRRLPDGQVIRSQDSLKGDPVLIYPRSSKYQEAFDPPYLDMLGAFQAALREPDTAIIISGFGFNDDHISSPIMAAIESNLRFRMIVCDPFLMTDADQIHSEDTVVECPQPHKNKFLEKFTHLAQTGDPRIHLINGRFEDMVEAIPDLIGETDREKHIKRIAALKDQGAQHATPKPD